MCFLKVILVALLCGLARVSANDECRFNLCDDPVDYPEKEILSAISKNDSFNSMFGDVFRPKVIISDRMFEEDDSNLNVCPTEEMTFTPRSGINIYGDRTEIVNVEGYPQIVTIQACAENAQSTIDNCLMHLGYKTSCDPQYATVRLVVYNNNKDLEVQEFSLPTGCVCNYYASED